MARYQAECELAEALAVQAMSSEERYLWRHKVWARLQANASVLLADRPATRPMALYGFARMTKHIYLLLPAKRITGNIRERQTTA